MFKFESGVLLLLALSGTAHASDLDSKPLEEVLPLARSGNHDAIHHMCFAYKYGEYGATQDEDQAFEWCTRSHEDGEPAGTTLLAEIHSMGSEKRRDLPRAKALYRQAAEAGHDFAMFALGVLLLEDKETAREAIMWLNKAHEAGIPEATALLDRLKEAIDKSRAP